MSEHLEPGQKFGSLTIIRAADKNGRSAVCLCICQRSCVVSTEVLRAGEVTSCGCRPLTTRQWEHKREIAAEQKRKRELAWSRTKTE